VSQILREIDGWRAALAELALDQISVAQGTSELFEERGRQVGFSWDGRRRMMCSEAGRRKSSEMLWSVPRRNDESLGGRVVYYERELALVSLLAGVYHR
jgi:hypothetical protein